MKACENAHADKTKHVLCNEGRKLKVIWQMTRQVIGALSELLQQYEDVVTKTRALFCASPFKKYADSNLNVREISLKL